MISMSLILSSLLRSRLFFSGLLAPLRLATRKSEEPLFLISTGLIPRSLLRNGDSKPSRSPSFPHAFSGNPGEIRTGPPIRTFGGDAFGTNSHQCFLIPPLLAAGFFTWRGRAHLWIDSHYWWRALRRTLPPFAIA